MLHDRGSLHGEARVGHLLERIEALAAERDLAIDRGAQRARGVVHTPAPIARSIARAIDRALREDLRRPRGLADPDVVIVDPATGPGIFLGAALEVAGEGAPRACVGLDVDPDAIARAESVLAPAARARGWPLALAVADALGSIAPHPALEDDDVVRVVLGNPPWAGRSASRGAASDAMLEDFRRDVRGERKIGVLSDDYVRFVRWACELARTARRGAVIGLVTNASYLDGPVHRGMRAAMRRWLDRIEVTDLGGSALTARRAGSRDENVFAVRVSAAIVIGVRRPGPEPRPGTVSIARLRGSRAEKLAALDVAAPRPAVRAPLDRGPSAPRQLDLAFDGAAPDRPADAAWIELGAAVPETYFRWPSLVEWMPFHREGLQTNRDDLVIARDREELVARLEAFAAGAPCAETAHWSPERGRAIARSLLADRGELERHLRPIAYRPLDDRIALVHPGLCHRPRPELARAIDASSLVLLTARKDRGDRAWAHFGATRLVPDNCWLSSRSSCRTRAFPTHDPAGAPNVDRALAGATSAEDVVGWALAWMASSAVREACDAALRADYPRIPRPRDPAELAAIAGAGRALAAAMLARGGDGPGATIGHRTIASAAIGAALREIDARIAPGVAARLSGAAPSG